MTGIDPLHAIGAADGRYRNRTASLENIVSEYGLIRYRVLIECEWFLFLSCQDCISEFSPLSAEATAHVKQIIEQFDTSDAQHVKDLERTTNHDVKAVEYFVKEKMAGVPELQPLLEWVHFGCTSEDINNTAYGLMLTDARNRVVLPLMDRLAAHLQDLAAQHANLAMLSRTHGQTASPTTLGKELRNVVARLQRQQQQLASVEILGKFNGAVGNFNAHMSAYPNAPWPEMSASFLSGVGLTYNPFTTQIEPHDYMAEMFHALMRFNQVLLDFNRDIWSYISIDYFTQKKVEGETGSSTMPHKVNPIDFENSEGNLGIANALLDHMASKLPVSRWQRDLSDSTVLRNIGTAIAHCVIAYEATLKGLGRLEVNSRVISDDLNASWEVLAEPVQTVMRKYGMAEPYERLKEVTRGRALDEELFRRILDDLELPEEARQELSELTPERYTGLASHLAQQPSS